MKIQLKRSNVLESGAAKTPSADQLEYGEIAINYNDSDPSIFMKDSNNQVIRISGENAVGMGQTQVPIVATAPSNPVAGNQYFDTDDSRLYVYTGSAWVRAEPLLTTIADLDVTNTLDISGTANFTSNVGFGVASPSHALDISNASNAYIRQTRSNSTLRLGPAGTAASDGAFIGTDTTGPLRFYTNGSSNERLRIDTEGRVGINEISPLGILHVKEGESGVTPNTTHDTLFIENNDNAGITIGSPNDKSGYLAFADPQDNDIAKIQYAHTDNQLSFTVNAGVKAVINSTGNFGINTTSPSRKLEVVNDDDYALKVGGTTSGGYYLELGQTGTNGSAGIKYLGSGGSLKFSNVDGEVARFDPDGDFGIGGSPTSTASTKTLQITDSTTARMLLESTGSGGRKYGWYTSVDGQLAVYDYTANAERIRVTRSGNFGINETDPSANLVVRQSGSTFTAQSQTVALFQRSSTTGHGAKIAIVAGNAASSDINFGDTDDEDAGLIQYVHTNNSFKFCTASNTTSRLTIDSSGNITIPGNLTVNGSFSQPSGDSSVLNSASVLQIGTTGNFDLELLSNNNKSIVVKNTGKVGIDTDSPGKKLSIQDSSTPSLGFYTGSTLRAEFNATSAETSILSYANSPITFNVGGSAEVEAIHINSSGEVGIGVSPDADLHVKGGYPTVHIERDHATNYSRLLLDNTANDGGAIDGIGDDTGGMRFSTSADGTITERLRLGATGNLEFKSTSSSAQQELLFSDGTSGRGRIIYRHDGDSLAFETLSTGAGTNEAMRILSSGNVGIGTSSPTDKLSIHTAPNSLVIGAKDTTRGNHVFQLLANNTAGDGELRLYKNAASGTHGKTVEIKSTGVSYFNGGNVGIGTETPGHNLEVKGSFPDFAIVDSDTTNDKFRILHNGGSTQLQVDPNNVSSGSNLLVTIDGSNAMKIDSSGNVAVGMTNNVQGKLSVFSGTDFTTASQGGNDNIYLVSDATSGNNVYGASIAFSRVQYPDRRVAAIASVQTTADEDHVGLAFFTHPSSDAADAIVEAMRINSSGNLGIGETAPNTKLVVKDASNGLTDSIGNINVISSDSAAVDKGGSIGLGGFYNGTSNSIPFANLHGKKENGTGNNADGYFAISTRNSSTGTAERVRVNSSGNVGIGQTNPSGRLEVNGGYVTLRSGASAYPDGISAPIIYGSTGGGSNSFDQTGNLVLQSRSDAGSYNICFVTGDTPTERLRITSAGNAVFGGSGEFAGLVGVTRALGGQTAFASFISGSTDSTFKVTAAGAGTFAGNVGVGDYISVDTTRSGTQPVFIVNSADGSDRALINANGSATFAGNVGIGGTSSFPANGKNLKISDGTISRLVLEKTGTGARTFELGAGNSFLNVYDATADEERMRIDSDGRLRIGASSGTYSTERLVVKASSSTSTGVFIHNSNGATNSSADLWFGNWSGATTAAAQARIQALNTNVNTAATDLVFSTYNGSAIYPRMRIDSGGNLLLGTDTAATDADVTIRATAPQLSLYATPGNITRITMGDTDDHDIGIVGYDNGANAMFFNVNNGTRLTIGSTGNAVFGGSATFAGTVDVGGFDLSNTSASGIEVRSGGELMIQRASNQGTSSLLDGRLGSTQTVNILANGKATFVNRCNFGSSSVADVAGKFTNSTAAGEATLYITNHNAAGDVFSGRDANGENSRIGADGSATFGPSYDRITIDPGSGAYDGDPSALVVAGKTNDGLQAAFKIRRYDNSNNYVDKVIIDYAGNIGIGNNFVPAGSANNTLGAINKGMLIQGSDAAVGIRLHSSNGSGGIMEMFAESGGFSFDTRGSSFIRFKNAGSEFMRIDGSTGYMGVGTDSNLFYRITLPEGSGDGNRIGWRSASGNRKASIDCGNTDSLVLRTGASDDPRVTISSVGNVQIGNTAASAHGNRVLQVGDTSRSATYVEVRTSTTGDSGILFSDGTAGDTSGYRGTIEYSHGGTNADSLFFKTAATNQLRITSTGNAYFSGQVNADSATGAFQATRTDGGANHVFRGGAGSGYTSVITADGDASFGGEVKVTTAKEAYKSNGTFTVANDATATFNIGYGSFFVITVTSCSEVTNGTSGAFFANTASSTIAEISDPFGDFHANNNVANKTGVTKTTNSPLITIRNDLGASATYAVAIFGTST